MDIKYLHNLEIEDILDEIPFLYTLKDTAGNVYLSYLERYIYPDIERRYLIPLSNSEYTFLVNHNNSYFVEYLLHSRNAQDDFYIYILDSRDDEILELIKI